MTKPSLGDEPTHRIARTPGRDTIERAEPRVSVQQIFFRHTCAQRKKILSVWREVEIMNEPIDATRPSDEYSSLRQELLSLHERAHDVWRWGLIAILTVLGVVVATVIDFRDDVSKFPIWISLVAFMLYLFAAGIALTMAELNADIQDAMYRVGAYLAVAHELRPAKSADLAYSLGWHVWNRISRDDQASREGLWQRFWKHIKGIINTRKLPTKASGPRRFPYHGDPIVYVYVLSVFVVCISVLITVTATQSFVFFVFLVLPGLVLVRAVWSYLYYAIDQRLSGALKEWNEHWVQLFHSDDKQIKNRLRKAGLCHASNDRAIT